MSLTIAEGERRLVNSRKFSMKTKRFKIAGTNWSGSLFMYFARRVLPALKPDFGFFEGLSYKRKTKKDMINPRYII